MKFSHLSLAFLIALLAACNVGPKYVAPTVPAPPPAFKEASKDAFSQAPPGSWEPALPQDSVLKGKWWELFKEPELNALEEQLNIDNQNIAQYFQNLMAARAQVREARAGYYPTVAAGPAVSVSRSAAGTTAASTKTSVNSDFSLPFDVSWEPDLWGRVRNTVLEYRNAAQVSAADLENERLTEQAALAEYFFELRGQDALQDIYNQTIKVDRQSLDLTRALYETGVGNQEAVVEAQVTLKNAEAAGIGIAVNRAIYEHAIATLIGKSASEFSMPVRNLSTAVPTIPIGVPSQLLQRRPDIAGAERTMAQANALIGVEKAAYYPTVSLSGSGGLQSSVLSKLFSIPALVWSLGASASETLFDAGLRKATLDQYSAVYKGDVAAYKQTVLTAFQQVEDYISTLRVLAHEISKQQEAIASAQNYVDIATSRYQTGLDPYLDVITAQNTLLSGRQTEMTLRVSEMEAAVQLIQALGGGWDVTQLPSEK